MKKSKKGLEMTMKDFIEEMKHGWGFYNPYDTRRIGLALEKIVPKSLLEKNVIVDEDFFHTGSGPDFRYHYWWIIKGLTIKELGQIKTGALAPGIIEKMFGCTSLPQIYVEEGKLIVGFSY